MLYFQFDVSDIILYSCLCSFNLCNYIKYIILRKASFGKNTEIRNYSPNIYNFPFILKRNDLKILSFVLLVIAYMLLEGYTPVRSASSKIANIHSLNANRSQKTSLELISVKAHVLPQPFLNFVVTTCRKHFVDQKNWLPINALHNLRTISVFILIYNPFISFKCHKIWGLNFLVLVFCYV